MRRAYCVSSQYTFEPNKVYFGIGFVNSSGEMKCFQFIALSFWFFGVFDAVSSYKKTEDNYEKDGKKDTLIAAHVLYRHGARTIDSTFPNDPYGNDESWPEGIGQLTNEGKDQQYNLGKYLRKRYIAILGPDGKYSPNKVYIRSTDVDRTLMSAQANLAGLFFPSEEERWNSKILWIPIPLHTVPKELDYTLYSLVECPMFATLRETYLNNSKEVQRIMTEYADIFSFLSEKTGTNITTMYDIYKVYDTFKVENYHNKSLPKWAKKVIEPGSVEEYIATYDFKTYTDTPEMGRLISGFLFKEILQHFSEKINRTLKPDRSLWLYSAHDFTIANMLNALRLYELHIPPYASSLHFELFKTDENEHYVQIYYRKFGKIAPMLIPKCGEKCPLSKMYEIYKEIIPGDFSTECALKKHYTADQIRSSVNQATQL